MPEPARATPGLVYAPELGAEGSEVALSASESHYVARVCRVRPGEPFEATDGRGRLATLRAVGRGASLKARVESIREIPRGRRAVILTGEPEGQRDPWLVEKLAEIGVERWIPLVCDRAAWPGAGRRHARWERVAIAAMKQSRSAFRMEIGPPATLGRVLGELPVGGRRWLARLGGDWGPARLDGELVIGAVGPAAGFSPREESILIGAGFAPLRLAEHRLRTETAAIALASLWGAGTRS